MFSTLKNTQHTLAKQEYFRTPQICGQNIFFYRRLYTGKKRNIVESAEYSIVEKKRNISHSLEYCTLAMKINISYSTEYCTLEKNMNISDRTEDC